ncbi:MAG: hypothetical protein KatS3mg102_1231 [Planctomycetota bacterium]|nr:MAG: hypothetical protein KatS3mg102_1231 [Planctomycetota bacterium]
MPGTGLLGARVRPVPVPRRGPTPAGRARLSSHLYPLRSRSEAGAEPARRASARSRRAAEPARQQAGALDGLALVEACCAEAPGAWERFVERYAPLIMAVARRTLRARGLSPAPDDVEDICENTFYAFVKDDFHLLRNYDPRFALSTYVGVVARTQAHRYLRRRRLAAELDVAELQALARDPLGAAAAGDLEEAVRACLAELGERDRKVLIRFYFEDRDYQAIARELGISTNSVGAALHRARQRLRRRLRAAGVHGP